MGNANDKKINLSSKSIRNLDVDIKRFDNIRTMVNPKSISLSKNKIVVISPTLCEEVAKLPNVHDCLRELKLNNNNIIVIPGAFLHLVNLEILRLDHNAIDSIPPKFANCLYNLKELWLNYNKLKEIPWNFNKLHQLTTLYLDNNNIKFLPNTFGELRLEELSLQENPLDPNLFQSMTVEGTLEAILAQKIPKEYSHQVQLLIEEWELETKGKTELQQQFLFFLQQEEFRKDFHNYMKIEYSHENLEFWQMVDHYKWRFSSIYEINFPPLVEKATEIYRLFIVDGAPHSINIPAKESEFINALFQNPENNRKLNQWIFDGAYNSTLDLMYTDTFSRYKVTEDGMRNFSKAVKMWEALPMNRIKRMR